MVFENPKKEKNPKIFYSSAYLASISVLGSVLAWAMAARVLPSNPLFRILVALGSAWGMVRVKRGYLKNVDTAVQSHLREHD